MSIEVPLEKGDLEGDLSSQFVNDLTFQTTPQLNTTPPLPSPL